MHDYDQLFKKLLRTFFPDLLSLVCPLLLSRVDVDQVTFDDKELFAEPGQTRKRFADVVARLPSRENRGAIVVAHVEIERVSARGIGERMWHYQLQLQLREQLPVFPVVIFLKGGKAGLHWNEHRVSVFEEQICAFRYLSLGLSGMDAEAYLDRPEPLAWALAAFMTFRQGRARHKLECLRRISRPGLERLRQFLLLDAVQTRIQLTGEDESLFMRLLQEEQPGEVTEMQLTWSQKIERKALKAGLEEGRKKGRTEGRQEGRVEAARDLLKVLLIQRFGLAPEEAETRLEPLNDPDVLSALFSRGLTATSIDELGLA